ncbi:SDR family NAD(P)-dependent oxidoreductase [Reyranella sp.]|uniref:SDR family NAD(P)-dependent oxidoreductase n=1 Tax=Reyranella sp. TaxID=1929291 RepID=UPI003BAD108D
MKDRTALSTALVTGASAGIGAVYADRLARRGHDLVLVARSAAKLEALAARLRGETGVTVEVLAADLVDPADRARVERRLRDDARIGLLVNNAGTTVPGGFANADLDTLEKLVALNVTAVTRLAAAVAPRFSAEGQGAIVNIASVLALAPEVFPGIYPATKAYVLTLSQSLAAELGPRGVYVQAVLPGATRTEIWAHAGRDVDSIPGVMEVDDLVDAALVGFDRREPVTIPPLPDAAQWDAFATARLAMLPNFRQSKPAARYRAAVPA